MTTQPFSPPQQEFGTLRLQVSTALGAFPVPNAIIEVLSENGGTSSTAALPTKAALPMALPCLPSQGRHPKTQQLLPTVQRGILSTSPIPLSYRRPIPCHSIRKSKPSSLWFLSPFCPTEGGRNRAATSCRTGNHYRTFGSA